jgi:hypothetical protein
MFNFFKKKLDKSHNKEMIKLGRSWFPVVRTHIRHYKIFKDFHYLELAERHLSYAEDYLNLMK